MMLATGVVWIGLFLMLAFFLGMLFLQWYLCGRENKYAGLILPIVCFLNSIVSLFSTPNGARNFISGNVGTVLFLIIYVVFRTKMKKKRELEQMKIKDL